MKWLPVPSVPRWTSWFALAIFGCFSTMRAKRSPRLAHADDTARGRGLGRQLYDELLGRLRADGVHQVLAVIALPNDASEALHHSCGFSRVGLLPEVGWKFDRWIDTAVWGLTL